MRHAQAVNLILMSAVPPAAAAATAVESAPAVPSRALAGRAEGGMKPPSARPAKKARRDAFDPMDPVSAQLLIATLPLHPNYRQTLGGYIA